MFPVLQGLCPVQTWAHFYKGEHPNSVIILYWLGQARLSHTFHWEEASGFLGPSQPGCLFQYICQAEEELTYNAVHL